MSGHWRHTVLPCVHQIDSSYPRRNAGLWCVSTRRDQHKAQKEMWLVSGLQDHRYLSVNKDAKMPVDGPLKKQSSVKTRRYVWNQRHAGLTGSICQPVTEFTYNIHSYPPPPCANTGEVLVPGPKVRKHGVPVFGQAHVSARHVLRNTSCRHSPTLTLPT